MPIVLIRQASPLTVEVKDDDGSLVGKLTVPSDDATELDWEVCKARGRPTKKFKMENKEIELRTVDGGGPSREQGPGEHERH